MADHFVDSTTGNNGDSGHTMDLAWATLEYAVESGGLSAGDIIWVRRIHVEYAGDPTSNMSPAYVGTRGSLIRIVGWPRAAIPNTTITSATWTNGSTTVDLVVGVALDREQHCGRWATAPNGKKFLITRIIDSNTLIIDREYSGSTVTSTDGKFQIEADEDYALAQAINDAAWTIKKTDYNADNDDLPVIDFKDTTYYFQGQIYWGLNNLEMRDGLDTTYGTIYLSAGVIIGCLFHQDNNISAAHFLFCYIDRCILEGSGAGSGQHGINCVRNSLVIKNSAIYNMGGNGLSEFSGHLENVNIGVEIVNATADIYPSGFIYGIDVKLGSGTKIISFPYYVLHNLFSIGFENYQKVLGDHKTLTAGAQEITSKDVVAGSGDPYKRTDGADKIIEVDCSSANSASVKERAILVFNHEFETGISSKSYRYYVQCKALSLIASELWLECEYVDSYDDTSKYTITKVVSDESCTIRSDVEDWDQYIEVTGIQPAVASKVRIRCFVAKYDADGLIFIDPQTVVS